MSERVRLEGSQTTWIVFGHLGSISEAATIFLNIKLLDFRNVGKQIQTNS